MFFSRFGACPNQKTLVEKCYVKAPATLANKSATTIRCVAKKNGAHADAGAVYVFLLDDDLLVWTSRV